MKKSDWVFFLSGAAALIDQVVWARLLARLIGSDSGGVATILAVFMTGLGLGALAFGGVARRSRDPVRLFFVLETIIAIWTAASPFLLTSLSPTGDSPFSRALVAAALLVIPTTLMGATFPLMGRLTIARDEDAGAESASFYAANTFGAAFGALAAPFLLMPLLGLQGALFAGAAFDFVAGLLAWRLLRAPASDDSATVRTSVSPPFDRNLVLTLVLGFSSLALEVLLTRLLINVTGASVYAFSLVLAVFLLGIASGSQHVSKPRKNSSSALANDEGFLFRCTLAIPIVTLAGLAFLRIQLGEGDLFSGITNRMPYGAAIWKLWLSHAFFAALCLFPPAFCFGAALPAVVAQCVRREPERSRESHLAWVYGYNTLGALLGSALAGFVLLPAIGTASAIGVALALPLFAAAMLRSRRLPLLFAATAISAGLFAWISIPRAEQRAAETVLEVHGPFSTASVERSGETDDPTLSLRVNGKVVATSAPVDLRLQRMLSHIPGLLHGDVESALVIGMGTGMTAGALLDLPTLRNLTIFEISTAVRTCAAEFRAYNGDVLGDARTEVLIRDGRHALARSERSFDLITSDPIHPWTRGSSDLYSFEHFERMSAHLSPGGIASQWLPLYQLSAEDVRTVVATWCAAFPHTSAWLTAYDLVLVGSNVPHGDAQAIASRALPETLAESLRGAGIHSATELAALFVADGAALSEFADGTPPMRDDRPVLEFNAPKSYLGGYSEEALRWSARDAFVDRLPERARPRAREVRELLMNFLDEAPSGLSLAAERYGERLLALEALAED